MVLKESANSASEAARRAVASDPAASPEERPAFRNPGDPAWKDSLDKLKTTGSSPESPQAVTARAQKK